MKDRDTRMAVARSVENLWRHAQASDTCAAGHPLDRYSTYLDADGEPHCRLCAQEANAERDRLYEARERAAEQQQARERAAEGAGLPVYGWFD